MDGGQAHRQSNGQSRQAETPRPLAFAAAEALFARAEARIALLARARPQNLAAASAAWALALARGEPSAPAFRHAPPPDLGELRRELSSAAGALPAFGALGSLYAERAEELELEARLAENVGAPAFERLARRRHPERRGPDHDRARELAAAWAATDVPVAPGPGHASDDRRDPQSLVSQLGSAIARHRLPLRVEVRHDLTSRAACGDGVIYVRAALRLQAAEGRRITAHELHGHALPRLAARSHPLGLLRVGSAGANDAEEGRALHIEEEAGLLDDGRRRELGLRHLAALWVAGGADAHACVQRLRQFGCELEPAVALYARVARGGGLCRELEYIPAWLSFTRALHEDPPLAAWLARGRVSLSAARVLRDEGVPQSDGVRTILDLSVASARATR